MTELHGRATPAPTGHRPPTLVSEPAPRAATGGIRRHLAWAGLAAPIIFVAAIIIGGALRPGYGQATDFLSELGESGSSTAAGVNLSFALAGGCLVLFAIAVGRRAGLMIAAAGLGFLVMATSPCSQGCPIALVDPAATPADAIHNLAAIVAIAGIGCAALELAVTAPNASRRYRSYSTASGLGIAVTSMVFLVAVITEVPAFIGISERVMVAIGLAWLATTAWLAGRDAYFFE